ncbi:hypothetical protein GLOIN_2v282659 [Rhizophagus irregularis DAOM 181602=DAOM 197198]|uniref:MIR domain-containing protein n=2 Tax=Rhizophagus irregularis TaxID=588596 RepID=A0A015JBG5_RHIIW|nr:hypothetical protein GLOIN_2v282659 [Rhizophagus irregularis DAOM 181602=DAOM 197198]EXX52254.1 hypothetical protein RirG_254670 [Rhizophagus irregularis DAOM 197198w]POG80532.1 hypothetical protein GLOIN_2v282659 [Rhizophagus irregularis DAOM 181602=DAOM 197198]|eukprot:XP_025187398.1 hypothetical protein GLOIN_2v282659 [Rhizophagus irregularis DAOM 181602=DAOM 197198]
MEIPKYNGTCHPNEYVKQMRAYCKINRITSELDILELCILMINSSIYIPEDIYNLDKLIKVLSSHPTFSIFKDSCKKKLQVMKYIPEKEGNYTATFLADFRSLCNDAEIYDHKEIKNLLFNTYYSSNEFPRNEFSRNEFLKSVNGVNSKDKIFKAFSDVFFDELKVVKYGSLITLRHVLTGKYLSSCKMKYETGSKQQLVFAGERTNEKSKFSWLLNSCNSYQTDKIFYGDDIYLTNKATGHELYIERFYKSPTGFTEVHCRSDYYYSALRCNTTKHNNTPYVKTGDIITLRSSDFSSDYSNETENFDYPDNYILSSHNSRFGIGNRTFQEVVGHKGRFTENDEVFYI